jgi:hypothetical protein
MPIEKDVDERVWCPGWWPWEWFDTCIERKHKWCYNFSWVKVTAYVLVYYHEACENGQLYTWYGPGLGIGTQDTAIPLAEICFDSPRSRESICDSSNTGLQASPLSHGEPFVSNLDSSVRDLKTNVVETGTFEFTAESGGLCQQGLWPWKRVLHEQVITATVAVRYVTVQWYIGGIPIGNNAGTISISASCHWPFPLPKGRSQTQVVQVKYEVITDETTSTIRIFNNPVDGSYSISIGMSAFVDIREFASYYTSWSFSGETCDFDPEQLKEKEKCLRRFSDLSKDKAKSRTPKLGEPVVILSDEIWRFIREERREDVNSLLQIITNTVQDDPDTFTRAMNQLEQEIGLVGVSRLITIGAAEKDQKIVLQR